MTALETWVAGDQVLATELNSNFAQVEKTQQVAVVLGEDVDVNSSIAISDGTETWAAKNTGNTGTDFIFGHDTDGTAQGSQVAQSFTTVSDFRMSIVSLRTKKTGTPSGNIVCALQADSSGSPSGIDLDTATVAFSGIGSSFNSVDFNNWAKTLIPSGTYWIVFRVSGSLDGSNYGNLDGSDANDFTGGAVKIKKNTGGAWTVDSANHDLHGVISFQIEAGRGCNASAASNDSRARGFIGLAQTSGSRGDIIYVTTFGYHDAESAIYTEGEDYFLQDTDGTIGTSNGTETYRAGIALSNSTFFVRVLNG
jgi:hypothetical protein